MNSLKDDLLKTNNYSVLCDGSTDKSVTEQEVIFVLFLQDSAPKLRYFSTECSKYKHSQSPIEHIHCL